MISWIQRYFQNHFKTIFAVLLAATIISFIFTIGAMPGIGSGDRRIVEHPFFGYNLSLAQDRQRLKSDGDLSATLQFGPLMGISDDQLTQFAYTRAAALYLADKWRIPQPTPEEVRAEIRNLRMFTGSDGQFDANAYNAFRTNLKVNPQGATEEDVRRVIADDVRVAKVEKLLAGPGYVLASDVKNQLEKTDTTWTLETATAEYSAFKPDVNPTTAELTKYFEDNAFRYEIPPRVVASYVLFPLSDYVVKVSVTDEEVRQYYDANPARFQKPPEASKSAKPKPANPDADFSAVKPQVEKALKLHKAKQLALDAASDLAVAIFDSKVQNGAPLDAFLAGRKLELMPLAPFTRDDGPVELGRSPEIANAAFDLSQDRFVSDALPTSAGAVVLFWKGIESAHKPQFTAVESKVKADYVKNETQKRFVEAGRTMKARIEKGLHAGETFDTAAAAASDSNGLKLDVKHLKPFSIFNRPQDIDYSVLGTLDTLRPGGVSNMVITSGKGTFVFAETRKLPNLSESNPRFVTTREQLAFTESRLDSNAYLKELVDRELVTAHLKDSQ